MPYADKHMHLRGFGHFDTDSIEHSLARQIVGAAPRGMPFMRLLGCGSSTCGKDATETKILNSLAPLQWSPSVVEYCKFMPSLNQLMNATRVCNHPFRALVR